MEDKEISTLKELIEQGATEAAKAYIDHIQIKKAETKGLTAEAHDQPT